MKAEASLGDWAQGTRAFYGLQSSEAWADISEPLRCFCFIFPDPLRVASVVPGGGGATETILKILRQPCVLSLFQSLYSSIISICLHSSLLLLSLYFIWL